MTAVYAFSRTSHNNHVPFRAHDLVPFHDRGYARAEKPNAYHEESRDNQNVPDIRESPCSVLAWLLKIKIKIHLIAKYFVELIIRYKIIFFKA